MVCSDYRKKRFGFYRIKFFLFARNVSFAYYDDTYDDNVDGQLLFFIIFLKAA